MAHRVISILMLCVVLLHAGLGPLCGAAAICLGGGHEHDKDEVSADCELGCSHDSSFPTPIPVDDHDGVRARDVYRKRVAAELASEPGL